MKTLGALIIAVLATGCSVESLDDAAGGTKHNECSSDSECGGGTCDPTLAVCVAPTGQFGSVLFEVTAPANQGEYGEVGFLVSKELSLSGGDLDLELGGVAKVQGIVKPAANPYATDCTPAYGQFKVTFTPSARILGLPTGKYSAKTSLNEESGLQELLATIPPDEYDIYVEPDLASAGFVEASCPIAPQLFRGISIISGKVEVPLELAVPSVLKVEMVWSAANGKALAGWIVDVIDPKSGRVLSAPAKLEPLATVAPDGYQHFVTSVHYAPLTEKAAGTELVRVKPMEDRVAPTLVMERAAMEALTPGEAKIDQLEQLPLPVVLDSLSLVDSEGVRQESLAMATVRFVSTKLNVTSPSGTSLLKPGTLAFYERTEEALAGQVANVELLPGEYDVFVAPPAGSGFATTSAKLTVGSAGTQGGKTVTLQPVSETGGRVMIPSGAEGAEGAAVLPVASPVNPDPLQVAVGSTPFQPLASSGIVEKDGHFTLQADPGTFDFSIRPKDGTAFAWLVRPNVEVQPGIHDLGQMNLPLPVVYQGEVTVPESLMPDARIRAYLFLDEAGYTADREGATSVVQIAETRADGAGSFTLYLPSHLN